MGHQHCRQLGNGAEVLEWGMFFGKRNNRGVHCETQLKRPAGSVVNQAECQLGASHDVNEEFGGGGQSWHSNLGEGAGMRQMGSFHLEV